MAGGERAAFMALRNEHQRAVDRQHLVEEDRDIHRARLRHAIVARPGAVVLVPLPDLAFECGLGVELELMDVDVLAEQLAQRLDQTRMPRQQAEDIAEGMRGKGGARRPALFPPDFLPVELEDFFRFVAQQRDFFLAEAVGKEDKALFVEGADLFGAELHICFVSRCRPTRYRSHLTVRAEKAKAAARRFSSAARRSSSTKAARSNGAASGINVASAKLRATSGTIHRRGKCRLFPSREIRGKAHRWPKKRWREPAP